MMELNLTLEHMAGAVGLSGLLAIVLQGWILIRAIVWVFMWQLLTPTNDILWLDLLSCFALFAALETINFFIKPTQQNTNNV